MIDAAHGPLVNEGNSNLYKGRVMSFSKGRLQNSNNTSTEMKSLLKNQLANLNET